jgi:hypothetical protein
MAHRSSRSTASSASHRDASWSTYLHDWFENARGLVVYYMPQLGSPAGVVPPSSQGSFHDQAMHRIMTMRDERAQAAQVNLDPQAAKVVITRLDAVAGLLLESIQDTPDHLLERMMNQALMQDYERRFDEVMRLSDGRHH